MGGVSLLRISVIAFWVLCGCLFAGDTQGQVSVALDLDGPPIRYVDTKDNNRISRLAAKVKADEIKLEYTTEHGYLRSLLKELDIRESSQTLVFSKTSMQVQHISARNPRAIFFNDDTYVAWIRGSSLVEVSTSDPKLGAAFYSIEMMPWRAKVQRVDYDCLGCHATSLTQGVPGHTVRSVYPSFDGSVSAQMESFITDHSSPMSQRWGGWYVTGSHGTIKHMGNAVVRGGRLDTHANGNRENLRAEFDTSGYLSPTSDIVALMVLEHQTQMHNVMTKADFSVRTLRHQWQGEGDWLSDAESAAQVQIIAREVLDHLLFREEFPLASSVQGWDQFVKDFTARGPKDNQGRSLRDFDLKTRLFKYPCSFLIYSDAFDSLQEPLRREIGRQLIAVLNGGGLSERYPNLDADARANILAILSETKPDMLADVSPPTVLTQ